MKNISMSVVIKNLDDFEKLIEESRQRAKMLEETLNKLNSFEFDFETKPIVKGD